MRHIWFATRAVTLLGLVVVVCAPLGAGHAQERAATQTAGVPPEMREFLDAWLVYGNMTEAMAYFDGSNLSLSLAPQMSRTPDGEGVLFNGQTGSPEAVHSERTAYWTVLNQLWPRRTRPRT